MDIETVTTPATQASETEAPEVTKETSEIETETPELETESDEQSKEPEVEFEEHEVDGILYKVPKQLVPHLLRDKDYTQKSQANAEERRALEAERQAWSAETQLREQLLDDQANKRILEARLENYRQTNWYAWQQADPVAANAALAEYTQLRDMQTALDSRITERKTELHERQEQETAKLLERAVEFLNKPKPELGWDGKFDADKRASLTRFGRELGFSEQELSNTSHPLMILALNLAMLGRDSLRKQMTQIKPKEPEAKPVPNIAAGKTKTAVSDPDKLSPEQWVKWREGQLRKKAG